MILVDKVAVSSTCTCSSVSLVYRGRYTNTLWKHL